MSFKYVYWILFNVLAILIFPVYASAQCENSDFESGNLDNWLGFTGYCCGITTNSPGIVIGQHTITSVASGFDPQVSFCYNLPQVAPGSNYSCRLGNSQTGEGAERLRYNFTVTPQSDLIIYKYAVVLEEPGHDISEQPRFEA